LGCCFHIYSKMNYGWIAVWKHDCFYRTIKLLSLSRVTCCMNHYIRSP
jgi:hypothetical protein